MKTRVEPVGWHMDVEGWNAAVCARKARQALEAAGFKPCNEGAGFILRDERAISGEDSGSPVFVPYDGKGGMTS
jgi:hypothetical protein